MPLYVLNARRTPFGALGGSLMAFSAPELAGAALRALLREGEAERVECCVLGQAVQAGSGPEPAREAARLGGLPPGIPAFVLNQGRASGLAAVLLAAQGDAELAVAGGMESCSRAPFLLPSARWGTRVGAAPVLDALLQDADWPAWTSTLRTRDRALALAAREAGLLRRELVPLGADQDDLPPSEEGPAPADGAAVLLLGSAREARDRSPLARIVAWARGGSQAGAIARVLAKAGLALGDLACLEVDDPSPHPGANLRGGAPSLGLAPGAEGARKVVALAHQLDHAKARYGLAALEAGGTGLALILERP